MAARYPSENRFRVAEGGIAWHHPSSRNFLGKIWKLPIDFVFCQSCKLTLLSLSKPPPPPVRVLKMVFVVGCRDLFLFVGRLREYSPLPSHLRRAHLPRARSGRGGVISGSGVQENLRLLHGRLYLGLRAVDNQLAHLPRGHVLVDPHLLRQVKRRTPTPTPTQKKQQPRNNITKQKDHGQQRSKCIEDVLWYK